MSADIKWYWQRDESFNLSETRDAAIKDAAETVYDGSDFELDVDGTGGTEHGRCVQIEAGRCARIAASNLLPGMELADVLDRMEDRASETYGCDDSILKLQTSREDAAEDLKAVDRAFEAWANKHLSAQWFEAITDEDVSQEVREMARSMAISKGGV